jgi:hypothetical protein
MAPPRDDDSPTPSSQGKLTWLDQQLTNTNMVLLILFAFCCGVIALTVGIVALATCKDPDAKQRALIITIIAGICSAGALVTQFSGFLQSVK